MAFFSDVEHEVSIVKSGYRVTLTYNLYIDLPPALPAAVYDKNETLKTSFLSLLNDPLFLPKGRLIGFGLQYKYPLSSPAMNKALPHYYQELSQGQRCSDQLDLQWVEFEGSSASCLR